jgi:hypothetical protein
LRHSSQGDAISMSQTAISTQRADTSTLTDTGQSVEAIRALIFNDLASIPNYAAAIGKSKAPWSG